MNYIRTILWSNCWHSYSLVRLYSPIYGNRTLIVYLYILLAILVSLWLFMPFSNRRILQIQLTKTPQESFSTGKNLSCHYWILSSISGKIFQQYLRLENKKENASVFYQIKTALINEQRKHEKTQMTPYPIKNIDKYSARKMKA